MKFSVRVLLACTVVLPAIEAAFVTRRTISTTRMPKKALDAIPAFDSSPSVVDVTYYSSSALTQSSSLLVSDAMDVGKNVLIGVVGVAGLVWALTTLFVSLLGPKAVEFNVDLAKKLDPALWEEFESKLEPGQTIFDRPDLFDELSERVMALLRAQTEQEEHQRETNQAKKEDPIDTNIGGTSNGPSRPDMVNTELTKKWDD